MPLVGCSVGWSLRELSRHRIEVEDGWWLAMRKLSSSAWAAAAWGGTYLPYLTVRLPADTDGAGGLSGCGELCCPTKPWTSESRMYIPPFKAMKLSIQCITDQYALSLYMGPCDE